MPPSKYLIAQYVTGGSQYTIYANAANGNITFDIEYVGYPEETKPLEDTLLNSFCFGTTLKNYYAIDAQPYARIEDELNSPYCGYNPVNPGNPLTLSVVPTDETTYQANDGKVTPTVAGGNPPYLYSLDGVSFTPYAGGDITGLAPGSYILTIQDQDGLTKSAAFDILAAAPIYGCMDNTAINYNPNAQVDNGTCIYPVPTVNDPDARQNIYETTDQFRLIDKSGKIYEIEMPRGFDEVAIKLTRDPKYHGVNYEFSDGEIQLDFDVAAGKDLLQAEYDLNGSDGYMQFQFGMIGPDGQFTPDVDAYIDFNVKETDRDFFSASVKTKRFDDAIETKNEIDVTLKDGYFNMPLHSKLIRKQTVVNRNFKSSGLNSLGNNVVEVNPNDTGADNDPFKVYWSFLDFTKPAEGESGFSSYVNDLMPNAPLFGTTQSDPVATSQYLFVADGSGQFVFNIDFSIYYKTKVVQSPVQTSTPRQGYWSYKWFLVVNNTATQYELPGGSSGFTNSIFNDVLFTTNFNLTLNLNQGDRVYLYGQYVCEHRGGIGFEAISELAYMNFKAVGDTLATPTTAQSKLAFEVGQGILNSISGGTAILKSNLVGRTDLGYAEDGCAALLAYTNGYLLRNFPLEDRPVIIQLKDYIEGLDTHFAVGMGYELNDQNKWVYRLEQFEYFYQDSLIMVFGDVSDYKETMDTSMIYNKVTMGFEKYTQDLESVSTLDEFLTKHDYLTAIQSYKGTFTRLCKQIGAGYAIELTRRLQYLADPNKSWTYDDDNFIISTIRDTQYGYKPEKLENFTASGILSPETAYNIRLTITRMMARWGRWLNSGLAFKPSSAINENTYTSKNGDLTSQYTGNQACESKHQFTEADDLLKGDLQNGEQAFFPEKITFKTKLSWEQIREIRRCFINKDPNGRNNGYFGVVDGDGNTKYGFLMSMDYNPLSEEVLFVLRKKYVDLNEPFDCSEYSFYTFGDFEAATGLPKEIEQCLFENFA